MEQPQPQWTQHHQLPSVKTCHHSHLHSRRRHEHHPSNHGGLPPRHHQQIKPPLGDPARSLHTSPYHGRGRINWTHDGMAEDT
eukprot:12345527-Heterocapsa_arctica.AAC.1